MTIALACLFGALVVYLSRQHTQALERLTALHAQGVDQLAAFQREDRDRWAKERAELHATFAAERDDWGRERGVLLNRIKPETAQYVPIRIGDSPSMPAPLPYDDDAAFMRELEERESREEMAERMAREELNGRAA